MMRKILWLVSILCLWTSVCFADFNKAMAKVESVPVWNFISKKKESAVHNPNGNEVLYAFDQKTIRRHKSNSDLGFWLAKIVKANNDIEIKYVRISKDEKRYKEVYSVGLYLDGTLKSAKLCDNKYMPLDGEDIVSKVPAMYRNMDKSMSESNVEMPILPKDVNKYEYVPSEGGNADWLCFIDHNSTGIDSKDKNLLTLTTYAFSPEERLYRKGVVIYKRTGPVSYTTVGGSVELFTYEDKSLFIKDRPTVYISDEVAKETASYYYMFYRNEK